MSTEKNYGNDYDASNYERIEHRSGAAPGKRSRPMTKRAGKSPQSVNGIHKRRRRKMAW
ncbi:hypothetical protein [Botrimarina hoheduenensis]|uniref:Uncharacterized protein n=1 Tax=Botrimarina hoheduenensis TaxID=2528000 RepID=A0A5C5VVH3_9BACT|nr:hypothetical protein [Botrimarina hoheduenensis]TWT42666.1 hypothetical protein Pla111_26390 [Botrimarina hoheduenensis]